MVLSLKAMAKQILKKSVLEDHRENTEMQWWDYELINT